MMGSNIDVAIVQQNWYIVVILPFLGYMEYVHRTVGP
jgi:hypothetical protein